MKSQLALHGFYCFCFGYGFCETQKCIINENAKLKYIKCPRDEKLMHYFATIK